MIETIDPHLHFLLAHLAHVRPVKCPHDGILMQFAADCPRCGGSGKLSVALAKGGKILLNCHSRTDPRGFRDCVPGTVLGAIGLTQAALFAPAIGDGQPPYDKRTMSQMIATWLRTALRERTPAADVLKMFRGLASPSLVQKVRTEIGVEMTKAGFPAVPHWLPVGMRASAEPESTVESPGRDNGERPTIASSGADSRRSGIGQLPLDVENQPIASNGAGLRRGGMTGIRM